MQGRSACQAYLRGWHAHVFRVHLYYAVGVLGGRHEVCTVRLRMTHGLLNLPAFCTHQCVFVVVFSSPEYLTDLQGRSVDDPGLYWDFYGSSVCGEQMLPFFFLCMWRLSKHTACGGGGWLVFAVEEVRKEAN